MSQILKGVPGSGPGSGTVTSISAANAGVTLTPNPITTTGTIGLTIPVTVADGGTGAITLTANGVVYGSGTSAVGITAAGTTGQILTATTSAAPSWESPAASSISITGNTGGALTGNAFTFTGASTGLTFAGSGSTETLGGTLAIANGGTDSTSFATSTGIIKYDGTRLVTSSAAKISSSNYFTNSGQPAFLALVDATVTNVTGDGTLYQVVFNQVTSPGFDQTSSFNTSTGTFTAPISGRYMLGFVINIDGLLVGHTDCESLLITTGADFAPHNFNPYLAQSATSGATAFSFSTLANMASGDTAVVKFEVSNSTKVVGVVGNASFAETVFWGYLVC